MIKQTHTSLFWICLKLSMLLVLCIFLLDVLFSNREPVIQIGICAWIDCSYLTALPIRILIMVILAISSVCYLTEKKMVFATLGLSVISMLLFSLEEATGNTAENGFLSLVFFTQFIAYLLTSVGLSSNLDTNRILFPAQVCAAVYTLSGISKLQASGLNWFMDDSNNFVLEVMRVNYSKYVTSGTYYYTSYANTISTFILHNPILLKILLGISLLLELCSFCLLLGKKTSIIYTLLLLGMHLGIYIILGIFIPTIVLPMLIIFINPLYRIYWPFWKQKQSQSA